MTPASRRPRDLVRNWPNGPATTAAAEYCRLVAVALERELIERGLSLRQLALAAGLSHRTLGYILEGATVPDLGTLAAVEEALGVELLPSGRVGAQ